MHTYRPDIDGLRAVAILPVLFFHAGLGAFAGGYVGVDVFFVISGFLITRIIHSEIKSGSFSILKFYERRARRILPALFAVCMFSLAAAWWLFVPLDFKDFARSLTAAMVFVSNFLFMDETGYFAQPSEIKPLLHTWSLAVEEQYYIVFPLFLAFVARFLRNYLGLLVIVCTLVSFAFCVWATGYRPVYAFFLSPSRAWELLIGSVLALGVIPLVSNRHVLNGLSVLGLGLILVAIFTFNADTDFPGWHAAVPCLGAALLIYANGQAETIGGRILSFKPFVWVGLISYSLYLWHWPLIVFAKYHVGGELPALALWALIALSFGAAWASWRWIEQPFRRKTGTFSNVRIFAPACLAAGVLLTGAGVSGHVTNGFPERWSPEVRRFASAREDINPRSKDCHHRKPEHLASSPPCRFGPDEGDPQFMVWGDSHADAIMPAFTALAERYKVPGWFASYGGCPPLLTAYRIDRTRRHQCRAFNDTVAKLIADNKIKTVFLVSRWTVYSDGNNEDGPQSTKRTFIGSASHQERTRQSSQLAFAEGLEKTLQALRSAGARVILVEQVPEHTALVPTLLARGVAAGIDPAQIGLPLKVHQARQSYVVSQFDQLAKEPDVVRLDPAARLCSEAGCKVVDGTITLYNDYQHLTASGAEWIAGMFEPVFEDMAKGR